MNDQFDKSRKDAEQLLEGCDETAKSILRPLPLDLLTVGIRRTPP